MMGEREQEQREKTVVHLQKMAVMRIAKAVIARGFSTWLETYQTHTHRRRLLLHASANLGKPGLLAAFAWWHGDWETTSRDAEAAALRTEMEVELERQEAERVALQAELERLQSVSGLALDAARTARQEELLNQSESHKMQSAQREAMLAEQAAAREAELRGMMEQRAEQERSSKIV